MFCLLAAAVSRLDNRAVLTANLCSVVTAMAVKLQGVGVTDQTKCKQEEISNSEVVYILQQESTLTRLGSFYVGSITCWTKSFCTTVVAATAVLGNSKG